MIFALRARPPCTKRRLSLREPKGYSSSSTPKMFNYWFIIPRFRRLSTGKLSNLSPFRGRGGGAALRRGNAPLFSLGLAQRKWPRPVKRKALSRKVGAAGAFLRKTRGRRGRCCADLQTSTGCAIPLGNRDGAPPHLIVRHFFRRWSSNRPASLSAAAPSPREGESKGEGPQPLPFVSFQGGPGGNRNPPGFLFGGRGGL